MRKYISYTDDQKELKDLFYELSDNAAAFLDKFRETYPTISLVYLQTATGMFLETLQRFMKLRGREDA